MLDASAHLLEANLRLVLNIAEMGSFSASAASLGVTQPSISQQIKRLEKVVGCTLFRRRNTGVELTSDGEAVVAYARAIGRLDRGLRLQLEKNAGRSRLGIGMSQDVCRTALPSVLKIFSRDHPDVELRVVSGPYEVIARALEARSIDLAVVQRNTRIADLRPLWTDTLIWIGHNAVRVPISCPVPLILPMAPDPKRDIAIGALKAAGYTWRIALESDDLACVEAALHAGIGITVSPLKMRHYEATLLNGSSGLPPLPRVEYVMRDPLPEAGAKAAALAAVIRGAAAVGFDRIIDGGCNLADGFEPGIDQSIGQLISS